MEFVQIEIFHVGSQRTLDEALSALGDRIVDALQLGEAAPGSGVKTAFRFEDATGTLAASIYEVNWLKQKDSELNHDFMRTKGWRRELALWRLDRVSRKKSRLFKELSAQAVGELVKSLQAKRVVHVENRDRTFRPVRQHESHELAEAARKAEGVWLFLMRAPQLDSDPVKVLASAM